MIGFDLIELNLHAFINDIESILWLSLLRSMRIGICLEQQIAVDHSGIKHVDYIDPIGEEISLFAFVICLFFL